MNNLLIVLFLVYLLGSNGCNVSHDGYVPKLGPSKTPPEFANAMNPQEGILNKNYSTAEAALNKAIKEKNNETIRLGLRSQILPIRQKTAEAISNTDVKTFVPDLVKALRENQGIISGGTETQLLQQDLNRAIITAIENLTDIQFNVTTDLSPDEVKKFIRITEKWCKQHKEPCN